MKKNENYSQIISKQSKRKESVSSLKSDVASGSESESSFKSFIPIKKEVSNTIIFDFFNAFFY